MFVGGSVTKFPLHAISRVVEQERDLLLARSDVDAVYRFRFNTYTDALTAGTLMRHLVRRP